MHQLVQQCYEFEKKFEITRETWSRYPKFGLRKRDVQESEVWDSQMILREMSIKWSRGGEICSRYRQVRDVQIVTNPYLQWQLPTNVYCIEYFNFQKVISVIAKVIKIKRKMILLTSVNLKEGGDTFRAFVTVEEQSHCNGAL